MARSSKTYTFCGWIIQGHDAEYDRALYLIDHRVTVDDRGIQRSSEFKPLAKAVFEKTGLGRNPVTVNYHITDQPFSQEELTSMVIAKMCGVSFKGNAECSYYHQYSEITGYLWTTEKFIVGGHNMISELSSYLGKWCHLTLIVHNTIRGT